MKQALMRFNRKFDNNMRFHHIIYWSTLAFGFYHAHMMDTSTSNRDIVISALSLMPCMVFIYARLAMTFGVYSREEYEAFNAEMDKTAR